MSVYLTITSEYLGDTILSLSVALTACACLALFLLSILITLGVSPGFRAFFFRETTKNKSDVQADDTFVEIDTPDISSQSQPERPKRTRAKKRSGFHDAIPTVPLNFSPTAATDSDKSTRSNAKTARDKKANESIPILEAAPADDGERTTFTTRSITITRARSASATNRKQQPVARKSANNGSTKNK